MKKIFVRTAIFCVIANLSACSSFTNETTSPSTYHPSHHATKAKAGHRMEQEEAAGGEMENKASVGGSIGMAMDSNDKSKMFHALDNAPGKSTHWVNENTGVSYTVVPTKKISLNGNPYCREYQTTATKGEKEHQTNGTACVGADGNWHPSH